MELGERRWCIIESNRYLEDINTLPWGVVSNWHAEPALRALILSTGYCRGIFKTSTRFKDESCDTEPPWISTVAAFPTTPSSMIRTKCLRRRGSDGQLTVRARKSMGGILRKVHWSLKSMKHENSVIQTIKSVLSSTTKLGRGSWRSGPSGVKAEPSSLRN